MPINWWCACCARCASDRYSSWLNAHEWSEPHADDGDDSIHHRKSDWENLSWCRSWEKKESKKFLNFADSQPSCVADARLNPLYFLCALEKFLLKLTNVLIKKRPESFHKIPKKEISFIISLPKHRSASAGIRWVWIFILQIEMLMPQTSQHY